MAFAAPLGGFHHSGYMNLMVAEDSNVKAPRESLTDSDWIELRRGLVCFFRWQGSRDPEGQAQEALLILIRRTREGAKIDNHGAFAHGIAVRLIAREREAQHAAVPVEELTGREQASVPISVNASEAMLDCISTCLGRLKPSQRHLLEAYFSHSRAAKVRSRKELARRLGVSLDALRVRVHRLLSAMRPCVVECCQHAEGPVARLEAYSQ